MMIFGLLAFLFAFSAILMILLILVQKGKDSMGLGSMGGGTQMLFGGGGGQDLFQKITWVFGAILIFGSLGLAIWKAKNIGVSTSLLHKQHVPAQPVQTQQKPPVDAPTENPAP